MKLKISNRKKGFSLIEAVILLSIVGIITSGILALFFNVITINKTAGYYSTAYKIADSKIESLRNSPFESITNESYDISELPQGRITVSVTNEIDGQPQSDIVKVDLSLKWKFKTNAEIKESTYIVKGGIKK